MPTDEQHIRNLVSTWMTATRAGDIDTVLRLMTDDVVFLVPGRPPMDKAAFEQAASAGGGQVKPQFDGQSEIVEIKILGDWAYMWTKLEVTVTFPNGSPPMKRAGHTMSVLRKEDGRWKIARDANMLSPV